MRQPENEDDLKQEDDLRYEHNLKNENALKNEDNLKDKEDAIFKNVPSLSLYDPCRPSS